MNVPVVGSDYQYVNVDVGENVLLDDLYCNVEVTHDGTVRERHVMAVLERHVRWPVSTRETP